MRRELVLVLILLITNKLSAQDFFGMRIGNYAGVHGITINPAVNVNGPKELDFNFISFGASFESNYLYLEKSNIFLAGLKIGKLRPNPAIKMERRQISNPLYYNYFDRDGLYNFYGRGFVNFPGGMINFNNQSFALTFSNKFLGYVNRISSDYGYYYYQDSATTEMWLDPMKMGLIHYGEVALNYARKIPTTGVLDINVGITAKYLMGWDAVFLRNNITKESIKIENGVKIPEGSDVDFNWVSNYRYDYENDKPIYNLSKNGDGGSVDLGITIVNPLISDAEQVHKWKIGVAILDVGKIYFHKNAETNSFRTIDTVIYRDEYFANVKDLDSFRAVANYHAFGNYTHTVTGDRFSAWMPISLSVFGDFFIRNHLYISAHGMFRMPMKAIGLEQSNTIAVTPRIEKEHFEVAFPFILYNYKYPRAGFFIRKGVFFAGSDNMTAWLIPQKLRGMEFYMGFKWSTNREFKNSRRKRLTVKCPVW